MSSLLEENGPGAYVVACAPVCHVSSKVRHASHARWREAHRRPAGYVPVSVRRAVKKSGNGAWWPAAGRSGVTRMYRPRIEKALFS